MMLERVSVYTRCQWHKERGGDECVWVALNLSHLEHAKISTLSSSRAAPCLRDSRHAQCSRFSWTSVSMSNLEVTLWSLLPHVKLLGGKVDVTITH